MKIPSFLFLQLSFIADSNKAAAAVAATTTINAVNMAAQLDTRWPVFTLHLSTAEYCALTSSGFFYSLVSILSFIVDSAEYLL